MKVECPIWESCKHQTTSECFHCMDNEFAEEPKNECYEFNNWKDNDEESD